MREASRGFTVKFVQIYFDTVIEAGRMTAAGFFVSGPAPVSFSSGHSGCCRYGRPVVIPVLFRTGHQTGRTYRQSDGRFGLIRPGSPAMAGSYPVFSVFSSFSEGSVPVIPPTECVFLRLISGKITLLSNFNCRGGVILSFLNTFASPPT